MAAYQDYLDLKFAVSDHVGNMAISDVFPSLVQMAEVGLNRRLRNVKQLTNATLTFINGVATMPSDFLEFSDVYYDAVGTRLNQTTLPASKQNWTSFTSYTIDGTNVYVSGFNGTKDTTYYAKLPTLTSSPTATNWLLADAPDVYLYAVSFEAARHLQDIDRATAATQLLQGALQSLKIQDDRHRWGNSAVRMDMVTP